jgi:flagellar basal body rod protein FlgC
MEYYSNGVEVSDIYVDPSDPVMRYQPGHPDADSSGCGLSQDESSRGHGR